MLLSGLFLGFATGLKLTNHFFAVAMLVSLLALSPAMTLRHRGIFAFAAGGLAGFAASGGFWALRLERSFGNPVFPFFNSVFQSPWFDVVNVADTGFPPKEYLHAAFTYPFVWLLGLTHPTWGTHVPGTAVRARGSEPASGDCCELAADPSIRGERTQP